MANITLSDGTTTITLPPDLLWEDEYAWAPVAQSLDYTLTGAVVVQSASRLAGRPITLSGADDRAWVAKAALDQLYAMASVEGQQMTLTLADARSFTVMFRHQDGALTAAPLLFNSGYYVLTLRLMQV